jgi:hypothetical protein
MGIYEPITHYLTRAPGNSARLTFSQLEKIIGRPLPKSAYRHREWWSNNPTGHSHARSWTGAGWRTEKVDLEKHVLVFSRQARLPGSSPDSDVGRIPDPFGAMRGTVTFLPRVDLTAPTGEEWAAERDGGE